MTGGMAIVEQLIANNVDTVFGLPGAQMYPFFDALQQRSDHIRTYGARHEQACAYMAFGYARSTGKPGVYAVVPGPGMLNTTAALATALGACQPVLCITGQVPSQFLDRGRGHLHELPDQLGLLSKLVKWCARIERPADAPAIINEAFRQMQSGRPGPVAVEMAWDIMASSAAVTPLPKAELAKSIPPSQSEIDRAAKLLATAKNPMIFTGSGAQHASAEILALAELLNAPVTAFRGGRGVMPEDHPLGISSPTAHRLWPATDVAIGIGTRMELPFMRWTGMMSMVDKPIAPPHIIRIDIDPAEMRRLQVHAPIVADAAEATLALRRTIEKLRGHSKSQTSVAPDRINNARTATQAAIQKIQPQLAYLEVIRECMPRDGILVEELCQIGFTSYFGYPVYKPRTYISPGYQGTLGYGFPTALGVKAAHPDTPVVSIIGDGGFMFGVQEMATAVQERLNLITILFNNKSYGNVLRDQRIGFGNRTIGAVLENPDFQMLGKAFRADTYLVRSPQELRPALTRALKSKAPVLIEVEVPQGSETSPWEFIHPPRHI
ncbi:MAG: thiamine pyrophosphate-dependent enzyme [Hyphomicrobiaceae bacterium]|nr:hypothetical protein [Hyphomicrobiaceae bacterium]